MKENKNTTCDPCERDFEHKIHELEREGQAPTSEERKACEEEVKAAFGGQHDNMQHSERPAEREEGSEHAEASVEKR